LLSKLSAGAQKGCAADTAPKRISKLTFLVQIPDKAFHAIPGGYFRPPEVDEKKRRKREKQQRDKKERQKIKEKLENGSNEEQSHSDSESQSPDEEKKVDSKSRRKERSRRGRNSSYIDRGYESDRGPPDDNYFLPPPRVPVIETNLYPGFKPYNPADYAGPPTQEERDRTSRASRAQLYGSGSYREYPINSVAATEESNVGAENLPQPEDNIYHPPHFDLAISHMAAQQRNSVISPSVDPVFSNISTKAGSVSASPSLNPASSNSSTRPKERRQSTAQAKYTPINYTPEFYASSPQPPISDRAEHQPLPKVYKPPSPAEQPQPYTPFAAVQQPYVASGPFIPQPGAPVVYPADATTVAPSSLPVDPERFPNDRHFSPRPNSTGYYSPPRLSQRQHSRGSKDRDRDRDRADDRSRDRSRRSSRLREALKEHKEVGASAFGALTGGLLGNELGHGRTMGTLLGAAVGGIGANFAERMWEEERKLKHRKREDDKHYEERHYQDGYDSY